MWKSIVEIGYTIYKSFRLNKESKKGDAVLVAQLNSAFTAIEAAWAKINEVSK